MSGHGYLSQKDYQINNMSKSSVETKIYLGQSEDHGLASVGVGQLKEVVVACAQPADLAQQQEYCVVGNVGSSVICVGFKRELMHTQRAIVFSSDDNKTE